MQPARDDIIPTGAHPVARWCRETPGAIAIIENDVSYSYLMLAKSIVQTTRILMAAGLRQGMIVGIECNVQYLHLVLILACEILGAVHVCLVEHDLTQDGDLLVHCDFLCAETWNDRISKFPRVLRLSPEFVAQMLAVAVQDDDLALLERAYPAADIVRIGRTSGTTGRPKFVGCSRESLKNIVDVIPYMLKFYDTRRNFVSIYPFTLMGTYSDTLLALRSGSTVIYSAGEALAANARKLPACHTVLLVRDAADFSISEQIRDGRLDRLSIRLIGGFVPPALWAALRQAVTTNVRSAYSMNETSFITTNDDDGPGKLLPDVSVRIVDDTGRDRSPGEPGIILARTSRMAYLYLWDEIETNRHFVDGWYRTSDVGYVSEPGRLVVLGRADEMLNLGGIKIAPHPIEERIRAIDGVTDAVLLDLDDAFGISALHIVIERDDPALDRHMEARLVHLLVGHATSFKLHCVDRLPRTQMGKVQRNLLKQSLDHRTVA
jgi:acyl-coenzyme A synthetase/AMP-(fatty) acid ligase